LVALLAVTVVGVYAPATGTILWAKDVQVENYLQRQVVADGNWYMQDPFQLYVYDERTGSERWGLGVECGNCGPAAGGGRVYLAGRFESGGSGSGTKLAALDARTGRTAWSVPVDGDASFGSWPVLANGIVYLRTMTRRNLGGDKFEDSFWIEAHRATDGKLVWRSGVGKSVGSWLSPIAVGSGIVVYPSEDGRLHAIDAASGTPRWTMPGNDRDVRPAIANGLVWTGDSADRLVALDARDGRRRWASPPFPPDGPVSPVLAGGDAGGVGGRVGKRRARLGGVRLGSPASLAGPRARIRAGRAAPSRPRTGAMVVSWPPRPSPR
jgi:outer membrane protein assembly factor BamB